MVIRGSHKPEKEVQLLPSLPKNSIITLKNTLDRLKKEAVVNPDEEWYEFIQDIKRDLMLKILSE